MFTTRAAMDPLRTIAFGSLTGAYQAMGAAQSYQARIICFTNTTDKDVVFSMDGTTDQIIVPAGGFKLFDITTNHRPVNQDDFSFGIGTQWYVKYLVAPSLGSVYLEILHAAPQQ
jgi:hypothetical protein